jgi:uncharacterized membrane protein HdeD (DUF308 family)
MHYNETVQKISTACADGEVRVMKKRGIVLAIAAFVLGVAMFVHPRASLLFIARLMGVVSLGAGIVSLFLAAADAKRKEAGARDFVVPAALLAVGALLIADLSSVTAVLQVVLGVAMIGDGFRHLVRVGVQKRKKSSILLILGGITILLGFTICLRPLTSMWYTTACGLFFIFDAVVGILTDSPEETDSRNPQRG